MFSLLLGSGKGRCLWFSFWLFPRSPGLSFGVNIAWADPWPKDNFGRRRAPNRKLGVVVEEIEGALGWGLTDPPFYRHDCAGHRGLEGTIWTSSAGGQWAWV